MTFTRRRLLVLLLLSLTNLGFGRSQQSADDVDRGKKIQKEFVEPQVSKRVEANYSDKARASRITGSVVVEITVDETGNITYARPLSGHRILRDPAREAVLQWNFEPARSNGTPVKAVGVVTFCFSNDSKLSTSTYTFTFKQCCPGSLKKAKDPCSKGKKSSR
jgi:TonB family protein